MSKEPDEQPVVDEVQQMRQKREGRDVVDRAADSLLERYPLTSTEANDFLEAKAREGDRDPADVAQEILGEGHPPAP